MATKKTSAEKAARYRVARAFVHEGTYVTRSAQLADLPPAVLEERASRGFLEDRAPGASSDTAPAAKAKE